MLVEDHAAIDKLFDDVFAAFESDDPSGAFAKIDLLWAHLAMHIRAEHLHLFPTLLSVASKTDGAGVSKLANTIDGLREDHNFFMRIFAEVIKRMRGQTSVDSGTSFDEVKAWIETVKLRLVDHNEIEESAIYPLTETLLSVETSALLREKIEHEIANLPPRFSECA